MTRARARAFPAQVDGPRHFLAPAGGGGRRRPSGATALKRGAAGAGGVAGGVGAALGVGRVRGAGGAAGVPAGPAAGAGRRLARGIRRRRLTTIRVMFGRHAVLIRTARLC